jgi:cytochrome oxidase Cu insertion factor (SCO1/SenC/PrrC family)
MSQIYLQLTVLSLALIATVVAFQFGFQRKTSSLQMLQIGEVAPDFELKNYEGKSFKLSSFKGKKPVVVFFYPADNTPGCTAEVSFFV